MFCIVYRASVKSWNYDIHIYALNCEIKNEGWYKSLYFAVGYAIINIFLLI